MRPDPASRLSRPAGPRVVDCWNQIGVSGDGSCAGTRRGSPLPELPGLRGGRREFAGPGFAGGLSPRLDGTFFPREKPRHARQKFRGDLSHRFGMVVAPHDCVPGSGGTPHDAFAATSPQRRRARLDQCARRIADLRFASASCSASKRRRGVNGRPGLVHQRLVVAEWQGNVLTFPVDDIYGIHRYQPDELKPFRRLRSPRTRSNFTRGMLDWEDRMVGYLDAELVFATLNRSLA